MKIFDVNRFVVLVCLCAALILGCAPITTLVLAKDSSHVGQSENCELELGGEFADYSNQCFPIGYVTYRSGDNGLFCDRERAAQEVRKRACEAGATHARMRWTEICHRAQVDLFVCPEGVQVAAGGE